MSEAEGVDSGNSLNNLIVGKGVQFSEGYPGNPQILIDAISFMQRFDGTQPQINEEEQKRVKERFTNFVDDMMLHHIQDINPFPNLKESRLNMELDLTEINSIRVEIIRSNETSYSILVRLRGNGRYEDVYRYHQDKNGSVVRADAGAVLRKDRAQMVGDTIENSEENPTARSTRIWEQALALLEEINREKPNRELEAQMGINHCPISETELTGLMELIGTAIVVPPRGR